MILIYRVDELSCQFDMKTVETICVGGKDDVLWGDLKMVSC